MLVAGIGNIFLSDDGFGPEVLARLRGYPVPVGAEVEDYGIRGVHLAYRLLDGVGTLVFVDAAPHGKAPGTVSLLEVDPAEIPPPRAPRRRWMRTAWSRSPCCGCSVRSAGAWNASWWSRASRRSWRKDWA